MSPMLLLGRRVIPVASLLPHTHRARVTAGLDPMLDRATVATWTWPELRHQSPPPAVKLNGVLAPAKHWRTGMAAVAPFLGMCPTAVILPTWCARDTVNLTDADFRGVGVLTPHGGGVDVVYPGRPHPPGGETPVTRWALEAVYHQFLQLDPR